MLVKKVEENIVCKWNNYNRDWFIFKMSVIIYKTAAYEAEKYNSYYVLLLNRISKTSTTLI